MTKKFTKAPVKALPLGMKQFTCGDCTILVEDKPELEYIIEKLTALEFSYKIFPEIILERSFYDWVQFVNALPKSHRSAIIIKCGLLNTHLTDNSIKLVFNKGSYTFESNQRWKNSYKGMDTGH